ncbi:SDR family NAD(P)-dependent oxidoreductase [Fictibacillus nanhaiensis]|uniref:SDR family NAD(P)-dependent oxidoreductase n=1 Tax=Fictibacillus nanhaiensis TaxID=742169 RepID=UPI003C16D01B
MDKVYKYIVENIQSGNIQKQTAIDVIKMLKNNDRSELHDIAIIGISSKFPKADSPEAYWENITSNLDCNSDLPEKRKEDLNRYVERKGGNPEETKFTEASYLDEIDKFDYKFFDLSPKEASLMDPNQRLFLELSLSAIEDAGYGGSRLKSTNTGVYVGFSNNVKDTYGKLIFDQKEDYNAASIVGNLAAMLPSRISYHLDLKGPTLTIDTACSSSLVSVGVACEAIRNGQCEMALAGGIKLSPIPLEDENAEIGIESKDSRTRAFDDKADGAGVGEGAGVVFLKPLSKALRDNDNIYAVIKGIAINQDGRSIGITAPNPAAQTELLTQAWEDAKINPETVSYIETHGTATNLGDPIEIQGMTNAFKKYTKNKNFCAVSSVKTNIGHLFEAAGIANLIKAVMALKNQKIPPSMYFNQPNKLINFSDSPIYVNTKLRDWTVNDHPRRCGVSSFGISGTNCHIVLEEAPMSSVTKVDESNYQILAVSAKSETALKTLLKEYKSKIHEVNSNEISNLCFTANVGRGHYQHRLAFVFKSQEELQRLMDNIKISDLNHNPLYKYHKIIKSGTNIKSGITEKELLHMTDQAESLMEGDMTLEQCEELARLYISGASVPWKKLYNDKQIMRLPTYPFDRSRAWINSKQVKSTPDNNKEDLFYTIKWTPSPLSNDTSRRSGSVLIFKDSSGNAEIVKSKLPTDLEIIEVHRGESFKRIDELSYVISDSEEDYSKLFKTLKNRRITNIIHMFTKDNQMNVINDREDLELTQKIGLFSLFFITKAIIKNNWNQNLEILLVSGTVDEITGSEIELKPEYASFFGLGKTINLEYPHITCRAVELDDLTRIDVLVEELYSDQTIYKAAYREDIRYIEEFTEVDLKSLEKQKLNYKEDGVYVITGGTGGIGLEIAKSIASKHPVKLALIGRTKLPKRDDWHKILESNANEKFSHQIRMIEHIESLGSTVMTYACDVSNTNQLTDTLDQIKTDFKKINGIIHGAGIPGDGYLVRKDKDILTEIIGPKIYGTWELDRLTKDQNLDFFVAFSSGISMIGEAGQGDYVAANAYLDSFASYRTKQGRPTIVIDWVSWKSAGMSVEYNFNKDLIFKAIDTNKAVDAFHELLQYRINRVLIGELNRNTLFMPMMLNYPFAISSKLENIARTDVVTPVKHKVISQPSLSSDAVLGSQDVSMVLTEIYKKTLGVEEIDINENFFELGGNSLLLNEMHLDIEKIYPGRVNVGDLFSHTTIVELTKFICQNNDDVIISDSKKSLLKPEKIQNHHEEDIAIIGVSVNMPMADDVNTFWSNIRNGVESTRSFPKNRAQKMDEFLLHSESIELGDAKYLDGSYLENIDEFDYKFFNLTPNEAKYTDPHQRLLLQTIWKSIEDAGYGGKIRGTKTGVYVGFANNIKDSYQRMIYETNPEKLPISAVGNITAMMPTRISYLLDLRGPTMVIDTACSSTLVGIHTAANAIKNGDCEMAIVGSVRINLMPVDREYMKIGIESSNGKTMTFDMTADGSGMGEGSSSIILKPLNKAVEDGDNIYAVIKGSAINQDGSSMGITAPNTKAQTEVLQAAWKKANINPESLAFIEAHGTATSLGDPIEIDGLKRAFESFTNKKQFCAIGSVKTNVGHLFEGAGLAGFIKSILALKYRELPPTLNFNQPNPKISFSDSPVFVNNRLRQWTGEGKMRAGISSFGFSGTNCHVVLEESPEIYRNQKVNGPVLLTLSAKSEESLKNLRLKYEELLSSELKFSLQDISYTANTGREHHKHRLAMILEEGKAPLFLDEEDYKQMEILNLSPSLNEELISSKLKRCEGTYDHETLKEIGYLYMQGINVNWDEFYLGTVHKKVSIPTYPFEKNSCWLDSDSLEKQDYSDTTILDANDNVYTIKWEERVLPEMQVSKYLESDIVILMKNNNEFHTNLAALYKANGCRVIEVSWAEEFKQITNDCFEISHSEKDHIHLLSSIGENMGSIVEVVHLFSTNETDVHSVKELEIVQQKGVLSILYLTKALAHHAIAQPIKLSFVTKQAVEVTGKEDKVMPHHMPLLAFGKVIGKEFPNLSCQGIDIDDTASYEEVYSELTKDFEPMNYHVALRDGKRYCETFTEINLEKVEDRPLKLRGGGVYVITGGTGGIGLEVADAFASKETVNLVFLNRSPFPDKDEWDRILAENENSTIVSKIQRMKKLEQKGSTIQCIKADVTSLEEMKRVVRAIKDGYGRIDGIVHAAGVGGTEAIKDKNEESFNKIFASKVYGTWILDELTKDDDLDFFIMFSSVASLFVMAGQSDYTAANAFLDSYSTYRNKKGKRTITINWSTWKETGMSVHHDFTIDTLFKALLSKDAIETLMTCLYKNVDRALIGEINYDSPIVNLLHKSLFHLSEGISQHLEKIGKPKRAIVKKTVGLKSEIKLIGKQDGTYDEVERKLALICQDILGFDEINVFDNFFELGADSIILTQMHAGINKVFPDCLEVTDIFEHTTIHKLSLFIQNRTTKVKALKKNTGNDDVEKSVRSLFEDLEKNHISVEQALSNLTEI